MGRSHTDLNKSILMERILNGTNSAEGESDILKDDPLVYYICSRRSQDEALCTPSADNTPSWLTLLTLRPYMAGLKPTLVGRLLYGERV